MAGFARPLCIACFLVAAQTVSTPVFAQPGALDPAFDGDGRVTTDFFSSREQARDVAVLLDGRIVAAGFAVNPATGRADFALARYHLDGTLDASFGTDGRVTTDFFGDNDGIEAIAIQPDGKIVAAGFASSGSAFRLALARYQADGTLDTTFGSGGKVTTGARGATAVALQADGKLVVADLTALARFTTDGSLDAAFGAGGTVTAPLEVEALAVHLDGKIVAAGSDVVIIGPDPEGGNLGRLVVAVARFNTDGSPDATFGDGGKVLTELSSSASRASAVLVQPDGKTVAVGSAGNGFGLVRYEWNGGLDGTFGQAGIVITSLGGINDQAFDAALQLDGKIVAAGWSISNATANDFGLARYQADGALDTTFGNGGIMITDFLHNTADIANGVALGLDGSIVAAGWTNLGDFPTDTFALARYQGALSPQAAIDGLLQAVNALVDTGVLNQGQGNALAAKLREALRELAAGDAASAADALTDFIHQVDAFVRAGRLSASQGQALTERAREVADRISQ
jgi:uncharacterized delta-60 repeat protein